MVFNQRIKSALLWVGCVSLLGACGGSGGGDSTQTPEVIVQSIPDAQQRVIPTDEARAFVASGPYASVLKDCALATIENTCTLATLPFIGQSGQRPTVAQVMERVVVTHDWMGVRFEQMLRRMPPDMLDLFAPVTSIVIGSEVRPSSYSPSKARIRLDPAYLWLSVPEKRTIAVNDDFRTNFGAALQFRVFWRLALGDEYATTFSSLRDDDERQIDDLDISLARLLYHELAHANDSISYTRINDAPLAMTPGQAADFFDNSAVWRQLYDQQQLTAQRSFLYGLAAVRYFDDEPTEFQRNATAEFVGAEMANEGKLTFYGYSTPREDVATLFAAAMMNYHYDVDYHVGVVNKLADTANVRCDDYKVTWGVRNRLASPLVTPRAKLVVDAMLRPSANRDQFFATGVGEAEPLRVGAGWCDSVSRTPRTGFAKAAPLPVPQELDAE